MQPQASSTDESDLELLGEVALQYFKAEPSTIQPFSSSKLAWKVTAPTGVVIQLDATPVAKSGERWITPGATETYRLGAKAGRISKVLGTATVHINFDRCVTLDSSLVPQLVTFEIEQQINADPSVYFRLLPTVVGGKLIFSPSKPLVWITPDRLHVVLQLAARVTNFPDPAVDISVSFGLRVIGDSLYVFGDNHLASVNDDVVGDVSFPFWAWAIPVAAFVLPIIIDGAEEKARKRGGAMIASIVKSLDTLLVPPPTLQKHSVRLYLDPDGHGIFAVTFCPKEGPVIERPAT